MCEALFIAQSKILKLHSFFYLNYIKFKFFCAAERAFAMFRQYGIGSIPAALVVEDR